MPNPIDVNDVPINPGDRVRNTNTGEYANVLRINTYGHAVVMFDGDTIEDVADRAYTEVVDSGAMFLARRGGEW